MAGTEACRSRLARLEEELDGRTLLVRSDRVELSKNLIRGFLAFDELLESSPRWRGRLVFLARVYSSRESLPEYLAYRTEVQHVVARVNERWAAPGYTPVVLDLEDDFAATVAALRRYDLLLVNPVRDGLNLVAMEGPAVNERDGAVVLSREAGAYEELADVAIGVNPFDVTGTAAAMAQRPVHEPCRARGPGRRAAAPSTVPHPGRLAGRGAQRVPRFPATGIWVPGVGRSFRACKVELPTRRESRLQRPARRGRDRPLRQGLRGAPAPATAIFTVRSPEDALSVVESLERGQIPVVVAEDTRPSPGHRTAR